VKNIVEWMILKEEEQLVVKVSFRESVMSIYRRRSVQIDLCKEFDYLRAKNSKWFVTDTILVGVRVSKLLLFIWNSQLI
jgi:hypothetical protein